MKKLKLFGKRIKELRKSKQITQEELAEMLGIYQKQVGNIETGTYFTTMPNLEKLAEIFNVEIKDLFDFEHQKTREELLEDINASINTATTDKLRQIHRIINCILK